MKKLILAVIMAAASVAATAAPATPASPAVQTAKKPAEDPFAKVAKDIAALPPAAQGVAFTMAVAKLDMQCQVPPSFTKPVQEAVVRLATYAAPKVAAEDLSKAVGLGTQMSVLLKSAPNFDCRTSGLVQSSGSLPKQIDAEIKRAPNPKNFEIGRIAPMLK